MKKPLTIWFDAQGNLLARIGSWQIKHNTSNLKSEIAAEFADQVQFMNFQSYGTVRATFFSTVTRRTYCMFLKDFGEAINHGLFQNNMLQGKFCFVKKGQAQGIKLIIQKAP